MTNRERFLAEFDQGMAGIRKMLARAPHDRLAWRPHEKSMTPGKLANHLSALPGNAVMILKRRGARSAEAPTKPELMEAFDRNAAACREALAGLNEERFAGNIRVMAGVSKPVAELLRGRGLLNRLIHYGGRLGILGHGPAACSRRCRYGALREGEVRTV